MNWPARRFSRVRVAAIVHDIITSYDDASNKVEWVNNNRDKFAVVVKIEKAKAEMQGQADRQ